MTCCKTPRNDTKTPPFSVIFRDSKYIFGRPSWTRRYLKTDEISDSDPEMKIFCPSAEFDPEMSDLHWNFEKFFIFEIKL